MSAQAKIKNPDYIKGNYVVLKACVYEVIGSAQEVMQNGSTRLVYELSLVDKPNQKVYFPKDRLRPFWLQKGYEVLRHTNNQVKVTSLCVFGYRLFINLSYTERVTLDNNDKLIPEK